MSLTFYHFHLRWRWRTCTKDDGRWTRDAKLHHLHRLPPQNLGGQALFEKDSDGTTRKHIFAGSNRVCTITTYGVAEGLPVGGIGYAYYHSDHLGSSNIITDDTGTQAQYCEYTPYGTLARNEGSDVVKHKFTGKELDNTGLYFYGARYYDPEIGRFITADTIVQAPYNPQTLNRYSYCNNNPINYIDPTGHGWFKKVWKKLVGAIVGGIVGAFTFGLGACLAASFFWGGLAGGATTGALEGGCNKGDGGLSDNSYK